MKGKKTNHKPHEQTPDDVFTNNKRILKYRFVCEPKVRFVVKFLFIFFLFTIPLYAQEDETFSAVEQPQAHDITEQLAQNAEEAETEERETSRLSPSERQRVDMEIKTSTLSELAYWCRTLGLSESGTREELSRRLREHFFIREETKKEENQKVITIESAQTSEYFSIDVIDEDYARLRGDVVISLKDGDKIHKISANEILFNRTRNILTASGGVIYEKIDGSSIETFRGESITVNIDNWASNFLDGSSEKKLDSDGTAYLFSGRVISRSDEEVTILRNAQISSATNEEALWSINASKLWLLPGSDFAIFNAVLKVGEIPLMYIPFFYFPGDEMVFHPVIGYRSREGAFVQTTTYLIGQPKSDPSEQSSITRILGNTNDKEKELQGLFLRSTGKKIVDQNTISLKALIDYYVNLGAYIGLDFTAPRKGILNPTEISLGVGFTRTISQLGGSYTPYITNEDGYYDGSYDWNQSNLFSELVPFRYRMKFQSSIGGRYGGLAWSFPFYSDPFVDRDFLNRAETMDWMNMIQQGAAFDEENVSEAEIGDYRWHVNGNLNPSLPVLSPAISRISITNLSTTLSFRTLRDDDIYFNNPDAPGRFFFAPDKYTIYSFSGSISGTPVTVGGTQRTNRQTSQEHNDPLKGIGIPISPWANESTGSETNRSDDILTPPVLNQRFNLPASGNNKFSIDYSLSPTSSTELQFMTGNWNSYEQVDWNEHQSILNSIGGNANINFRLDHSSGLYNNTISLSGNGTWRDYSYLNEDFFIIPNTEEVDEKKLEDAKKQQYSQTNYFTSYTYNTTLRPWYQNMVFGQTNFQYTFGGTLLKSKRYDFDKPSDGPELTPEWGSWVKEDRSKDIYGLNSHRFSTNLDANIIEKRQNVSLSADLPPLDGLIAGNATFRVWISETNVNSRMEKPETSDEWIYRPVYFTETLRFGKSNSFQYYMVVDPEENNEITTIRSTLSLWNFRTEYTAIKTTKSVFTADDPLEPSKGGKWEREGDPILRPKELSMLYNQSSSNIQVIKDRINLTFNVNTALRFDLQQHTNSNFQFTYGFLTNITGFLELRLSATSVNAVIWRYFKNVPGMEDLTSMYVDGPQNNLFTDLFDSFNFMDDSKRSRSGFKMQRFDLAATHFLGDWKAEFRMGLYPHQDLKSMKYNFTSDISFLVQWAPITEIKTDLRYDGKTDRWSKK